MNLMEKECCDLNTTVSSFYQQLKYFILNKVESEETAEDLVQEVMVRLVKAHQKNDTVRNLRAWLFQIARNVIFEHYRKKEKSSGPMDEYNLEEPIEHEFSLMMTDFLIPMIELLPKTYGEPLKMSDIDKIPQKDIAKQLNLNISATKMRIQRGREKLRELFLECCQIEYDSHGGIISCLVKDSCTPLKKIETELKKRIQ